VPDVAPVAAVAEVTDVADRLLFDLDLTSLSLEPDRLNFGDVPDGDGDSCNDEKWDTWRQLRTK